MDIRRVNSSEFEDVLDLLHNTFSLLHNTCLLSKKKIEVHLTENLKAHEIYGLYINDKLVATATYQQCVERNLKGEGYLRYLDCKFQT